MAFAGTFRGGSSSVCDSGERAVVVCGLGSLGLECARVLQEYGLAVRGVDIRGDLAAAVDFAVVLGDCRDLEVLRRAGVDGCRAVLLVSGEPRINIEAALAVRKVDGAVRIVCRTAEHHINELLSDLLGNFAGYEPNRLAAGALALAALRAETIGYFELDGRFLRVIRHRIASGDRWIAMPVAQLSTHGIVVLDHQHPEGGSEDDAPRTSRGPSPRSAGRIDGDDGCIKGFRSAQSRGARRQIAAESTRFVHGPRLTIGGPDST